MVKLNFDGNILEVDRELLINSSPFFKKVIEERDPSNIKGDDIIIETDQPINIRNYVNFLLSIEGQYIANLYDELDIHFLFNTKDYLLYIVKQLLVREGIDFDRVDKRYRRKLYLYLPLHLVPNKLIDAKFIKEYLLNVDDINSYLYQEKIVSDGTSLHSLLENVKQGVEITFYPSGKWKSRLYWNKGKKEGRETTWYENGNIRNYVRWVNDLKEGKEETFYSSGKLMKSCHWYRSLLHGESSSWYEGLHNESKHNESKIESKCGWRMGNKHGLEQTFYIGINVGETCFVSIQFQGFWQDGRKFSVFQYWHPNGALHSRTFYEGGKKEGIEEFWDQDSFLISKTSWRNDLKDGLELIYYPKTKNLYHICQWSRGVKDGTEMKYSKKGKVIESNFWINGTN